MKFERVETDWVEEFGGIESQEELHGIASFLAPRFDRLGKL